MDRRVKRSKKLLKGALITLLAEKEFDKITVIELVEEADINRSTFYAHYDGKEDLYNELIDKFMKEVKIRALEPYRNENKTEYFTSIHAKMIGLFELFYEEKDFLISLTNSNLADDLRHYLLDALLSIAEYDTVFHAKPTNPVDMKLYKHHAIFGLVGLICYWVTNGYQYTPEEILEKYTQFERNPPYKFTYIGSNL